MRTPIIAGNWKLHNTAHDAIELVTLLKRAVSGIEGVEIVVCPVFTALSEVADALTGSNIQLGAQNVYWEDKGAFTGEVSVPLLKEFDTKYVIVGHSERRQYFGETDETVNKRLKAVLAHGLSPILCVGETLEQREAGQMDDVIKTQCAGGLAGLTSQQLDSIVIAYEPVWAIGTGKTATPDQAQDVHKFIRDWLQENFDEETANKMRIQYGGSVKPDNANELLSQPDIDGALVGGASLKADAFSAIVKAGLDVSVKP